MKLKNQLILSIALIIFIVFIATKSMATTATVNTDTLKLRKEASTDSTVLELLNNGQKLNVIEQSGDWVKVKVSGMTGFVHKDYIKMEESSNNVEQPQNEQTQNTENIQNTENTQNSNNTETSNNTVSENNNVNNIQPQENNTTKEPTTSSIGKEKTLKIDSDVYILPLINASKISNLTKDTKVTIIDEVKGWIYIQTNEVNGWIRSSAVEESTSNNNNTNVSNNNTQPNTTTSENPEQNTINTGNTANEDNTTNSNSETPIEEKAMYVNSPSVYVRKGPGTENEVVDSLILNAQVIVIAESGDWYKIKVDNKEGYIAKRLLSNQKTETTSRSAEERKEEQNTKQAETTNTTTQTTQNSKGQEIVNYAKQYLGCKYVYGGSGPSTFDCSGFTMYVYKNFGISLSHSATAQSKNGTYIAKEDLQPGDLVFFKDYETMDGIGHCGIYIGDGNFIHASSGTGYCVKISTLLSGSYYKRYETARRLI